MKQVVQPLSGGPVRVIKVPRPQIGPTEVLVETRLSVVSPGTERAVTSLAQSSLIRKARARPDLVRQVIRKARDEGLSQTARTVRSRLDEDLPLGYSAMGIVRQVGEAVSGLSPGQRVATGGAGKANHAEYQAVPGLLCSAVPDDVSDENAAFATIASIPLHGLRLAEVGPGSRLVVVGLGLLGQLALRLAQASGCQVAGIDVSQAAVEMAARTGALAMTETGRDTTRAIMNWSRDRGADAILVTAGSKSSEVMRRLPALCRERATVVVVGDVGLNLERTPFYEKELAVRFARSYGPGRYDLSYEGWGVDYPIGHVRWTEGRNLEAVLDLMATSRLDARDLITHRFAIADAAQAYEAVQSETEHVMGMQIIYPTQPSAEAPIVLRAESSEDDVGIGLIGAGSFAGSVLVPQMRAAGFERFVSLTSASGISARTLGERFGFEKAVSGAEEVIDDPAVGVVVIATPHDTHAGLVVTALRAGKHVYCEKPLALTMDELSEIESAQAEGGAILFVGFNRRWSEAVSFVQSHLGQHPGPRLITYHVNAGEVPSDHWYSDRRQGGRLLGEVCHFVDTCAALAGDDATHVAAYGGGFQETLLKENFVVVLRYPNDSLATISYGSGGSPAAEKERIDVLGGGHSASILDFRKLRLDGKDKPLKGQDKGHSSQMKAFRQTLSSGTSSGSSALASTRTTLHAAASLLDLQAGDA